MAAPNIAPPRIAGKRTKGGTSETARDSAICGLKVAQTVRLSPEVIPSVMATWALLYALK